MKIYVVCDLEGTAGVVDFRQQCMEEGRYYPQAVRLATLELNALVEGALEGGATEVYAWPGHGGFPGGIDQELIHEECRLVMHAGDEGPAGFDGTFDAMFQCGLHAMAGAEGGVLSHSFVPFLENVWLNDLKIGEIAMNMAVFGGLGVPCVFVGGDEAAVEEANALVPGIEGAVVKWGLEEKHRLGALSVRKAVSLSPGKARRVIREAALRAMGKADDLEPLRLEAPYTMVTEYTDEKHAERAMGSLGMERVDARTVKQVRSKLTELVF
jgi:D-amino peptidase